MQPFFSIIVPIYKVEKYLKECIDSILVQTFTNYELILVDDGSPDQSGCICEEYARNNTCIQVIHKENAGLSMARNDGLRMAIGKYVIFLDSDDYWDDSEFLCKAEQRLRDNKDFDILIFGTKKLFHNGTIDSIRVPNVENERSLQQLMKSNTFVVSAWDKIVSRAFLQTNGIEFVQGQMSEDFEWCIKLILAKAKIKVLPLAPHVYRQQNETSITSNISRKNLSDICDVIMKYKSNEGNEPLMNFLAKEYLLWMIPSNLLKRNTIDDLLLFMKKQYFLLDFDWYPYVHRVKIIKMFGFDIIRKILYLVYSLKRVLT